MAPIVQLIFLSEKETLFVNPESLTSKYPFFAHWLKVTLHGAAIKLDLNATELNELDRENHLVYTVRHSILKEFAVPATEPYKIITFLPADSKEDLKVILPEIVISSDEEDSEDYSDDEDFKKEEDKPQSSSSKPFYECNDCGDAFSSPNDVHKLYICKDNKHVFCHGCAKERIEHRKVCGCLCADKTVCKTSFLRADAVKQVRKRDTEDDSKKSKKLKFFE
jgi:hypothetical protein